MGILLRTSFSVWVLHYELLTGPVAPPAVLRSAAMGRKSLNSGGNSSSVYSLSEK